MISAKLLHISEYFNLYFPISVPSSALWIYSVKLQIKDFEFDSLQSPFDFDSVNNVALGVVGWKCISSKTPIVSISLKVILIN